MQLSPFFLHWQRSVEHRCLAHVHLTRCMMACGAGGSVLIFLHAVPNHHSLEMAEWGFPQHHYSRLEPDDGLLRWLVVELPGLGEVTGNGCCSPQLRKTIGNVIVSFYESFPTYCLPFSGETASVLSVPLNAVKGGRATALSGPKARYIG